MLKGRGRERRKHTYYSRPAILNPRWKQKLEHISYVILLEDW